VTKAMPKHHQAWLEAHPNRTQDWLFLMIEHGFHVHHIDGNPRNNDPKNLVLIEGADHMRLHGHDGFLASALTEKKRKDRSRRLKENADCYRARVETFMTWAEIGLHLNVRGAEARAREHAKEVGVAWPVPRNACRMRARRDPAHHTQAKGRVKA